MMPRIDLRFLPATALRRRFATGNVTAAEVVAASLDRIERDDGELRAFITVAAESARSRAAELDQAPALVGPLHGIPVAIKDLTRTAGIPTSMGSRLHVPEPATVDDPMVARLRAAGAVIIGKTNAPDFGFGSICTSSLRGATRTPYDLALSSEGSSGGSAAAVSAGMVPLATGGDFGGSLRSPASCCGIVSIRPTPGIIPNPSRQFAWSNLMTDGPMARNVDDAAMLLEIMRGADAADPLSGERSHARPMPPVPRLASSEDLGVAPVSAEVRGLFRRAVADVAENLAPVEPAHPDCSGAIGCFMTLRAGILHAASRHLLAEHGDRLPFGARWNLEQGNNLSAEAFLAAEARRSDLYRRFIGFFDRYDVLLLPAMALMPFPAETTDIVEIDGHRLDSIVDYYAITFIISLIGCPVVTLPAIWTEAGLPLGIQLVGRPHDDAVVIETARQLERHLGWRHRPPR